MKINNLGAYRDIDSFVKAKLDTYDRLERNFSSLYRMMFSEENNILYEQSVGYRIERTTYGECRSHIEGKAASLRSLLPAAGEDATVGLCMENGLAWIETFWAILRAGYRPLLMNLRLNHDILENAVRDASVVAVISDGRQFPVPTFSPQDLSPDAAPLSDVRFGTELYVMSSGTSDSVKICAYPEERLYYQIRDSYRMMHDCPLVKRHTDGELKLLTFLPFYHIFGLVAVYIWFGFFSRTFVHLADHQPATILNTIRRHKVTHIFAVPLFFHKVYDKTMATVRERGDRDTEKLRKGLFLSKKIGDIPLVGDAFTRRAFREVRENLFGESVRFMICGGSEVRPEVLSFFNAIGYPLANGYGMTEIGITSVELSPKRSVRSLGSVGTPLPSAEYRIGDGGELFVRGKAVCRTILEGGKLTENNGWYPTHDLAEVRDGKFYLLGRRDDVVIAPSGENLNPVLTEGIFRGIPGVVEVCLIGAKDAGAVCPVLLLSVERRIRGQALSPIRDAVSERLGAASLSGLIGRVVYTHIPLTAENEGKLNRRAVRLRYEAGAIPPVPENAAELTGDVERRVREIFARVLLKDADGIGADYDFFTDGGGTSLDYLAALPLYEEAFGISLPTDGDTVLSVVGQIAGYFKKALGET